MPVTKATPASVAAAATPAFMPVTKAPSAAPQSVKELEEKLRLTQARVAALKAQLAAKKAGGRRTRRKKHA
jgi:hypothetical protein